MRVARACRWCQEAQSVQLCGMLSLLVAVPIVLALQTTPASVTGEVRRADTGDPIVGAAVAVPELGRECRTDSAGHYVIAGLPAGPWHLAVRAFGFAPRTLHALVPRAGALEISVTLTPVPQRLAGVTVHQLIGARGAGDAPSHESLQRTVQRVEFGTYPVLADPDELLAIGGGEVTIEPETPSGVHIRGASADQTAYLLDGVPVLNPMHAGGMFSAWNPDAIATVRVGTSADVAQPHAVGGVVSAFTLNIAQEPGRGSASIGTSQGRLTMHGSLGTSGGSYLLAVRSAMPASVVARREDSYLRSEASDVIAKIELPLRGGVLQLLSYQSDDEVMAAAHVPSDGALTEPRRNLFEWSGQSSGVSWHRAARVGSIRIAGWRANSTAGATWGQAGGDVRATLRHFRRDDGLSISVERGAGSDSTIGSVSLVRSSTHYDVHDDSLTSPLALDKKLLMLSVFGRRSQLITRTLRVDVGASAIATGHHLSIDPTIGIHWRSNARLAATLDYSLLHQFSQSLRNTESVVGSVFPAELFVNAGSGGVPVATSNLAVLGVDFRPAAGVRLAVQAFDRRSRGLVLVAPRSADPFATLDFLTGSSRGRGASVEASASGSRAAVQATYGLQRLSNRSGSMSWVPQFGTVHTLEGGVTLFPTRTSSVRVGAVGGWGRRTTAVVGAFEWEACNLRDRGCEFIGTPRTDSGAPGATHLPAYFRVDLSARQHWHVTIGARDVEMALFGTVTNVGNRRNLLTRVIDAQTRDVSEIGMRPQAPLVVGLDWRF